MSTLVYLSLLSVIALSGCKKKETPPADGGTNKAAAFNNAISNNSSGNPLSAPADYLGAVAKGQQYAVKGIDAAYLTQAIQQFPAMEGRLPKDLNDLVPGYIGRLPQVPRGMKFEYDEATGKIKIVPSQ